MEALGQLRPKAALDVVVHSEVALNDISEILHNFVGILVKESLKFGHLLVVVEILFVLGVQLDENRFEVL